jgi:L-ascorbate metabolism protein UlaG (beta-lactamase superfamily)
VRLYFALALLFFGTLGAWSADDGKTYPKALPVDPSQLTNAAPTPSALPLATPNGVNIHWYGHGFVFLTSSVGVRAAIDPYGQQTVHYTFPPHLTADFVLVSHEAEDHGVTDQVFGSPLIFRSVTAVGLNRANGTTFHGVALQRDTTGRGAANTAFTLTFDGIKMGYLGQISAPLLPAEKDQLSHLDVLFLPIGLTTLTIPQLNQIITDVDAKVVIPINYKTDKSGDLPLRSLQDYLEGSKLPIRRFDSSEIILTRDTLPTQPTLYLLKSP